jgi:hypothetical protein
MNQGTQGYRLKKKIEGRKSRETVPFKLISCQIFKYLMFFSAFLLGPNIVNELGCVAGFISSVGT